MWDIVSRIWNELKSLLNSAKGFFFLFLLLNFLILITLYFFSNNLIISFIFIFILNVAAFAFIGKKRADEIDRISSIINNIRENKISSQEEIVLDNSLESLETAIRKMYERAKDDIEYLRRLERMRTEFLANVSHELRTPIFTIQGFLETLLDGAIDDKKVNRSFLEKANTHTINLSHLLNDLIDISMIESGEMKMSYRYFKINAYLEEIVEEFIPRADAKGLEIRFTPSEKNSSVFGDKIKIQQVITNLIQNAIRYTEKGSIDVYVIDAGREVRVVIKDTGIGIPEKDLSRVFERFYRVDKARNKADGGTGLGLAISKHIIEAHSSKIEVKSTPGSGSEFSFTLKK